MLKNIDEGWNSLIRMGRIHRGNRLLQQINFLKKGETFCNHESSISCNEQKPIKRKGEHNDETRI